jgi:adenylate cyclase
MSGDPQSPDADQLERLGLYDRYAPDASDRLELIRYVLSRGATLEEMAGATNLGEVALDMTLRPRGPLPLREVATSAGLDWTTTVRLMTAIGLSTEPDFPVTSDEASTVRLLAGASNDLLGEDATLQLARVTGNAMARLAETIVGIFRLQVELPRRATGMPYVDVVKEYSELTETLLPTFVSTLDAVLRRQIVAVAERMWSTDAERSIVTLRRTVGFVDLVDYTSATASLSLRELTNILIEFDLRTSELVAKGNGQIVKTIGDEAMFVTEDAEDACRIARDLIDASGGVLPPVRVGLAS